MITIPIQVSGDSYTLFVILNGESFLRIKQYDPAEVVTKRLGPPWTQLQIKDVVIMYATPEEEARILGCKDTASVMAEIKNLGRGWKYRPDLGDHDGQYGDPKYS